MHTRAHARASGSFYSNHVHGFSLEDRDISRAGKYTLRFVARLKPPASGGDDGSAAERELARVERPLEVLPGPPAKLCMIVERSGLPKLKLGNGRFDPQPYRRASSAAVRAGLLHRRCDRSAAPAEAL
jgi:hypothetical protein